VTEENTGSADERGPIPASSPTSRCSSCSTAGEWEAYPTGTRRACTPRPAQWASSCSTACGAPETTTEAGPLTAATHSRPGHRATSSAACAGDTGTAAIAPCPARVSATARLRATTTRAPSESDSPSATQAAATSPCEWPTTAAGVTP
jgi:hypothetical protein